MDDQERQADSSLVDIDHRQNNFKDSLVLFILYQEILINLGGYSHV